MKKQLILTKVETDYILTLEGTGNFIKIHNKVVNGQDLYDNFYNDINQKIEYIIVTKLTDKEDKIILNQLANLFKKIDTEINTIYFSDEKEE